MLQSYRITIAIVCTFFTSLELRVFSQGEPQEPGFLNVVDLIALQTPTYFNIQDFKLNDGTPSIPGYDSGFISFNPGEYDLTVTNEGARPDQETITFKIESGKNTIVICYDETEYDDEGEPRSKLRCNLLVESLKEDLPRISVVSLLQPDQILGKVGVRQVMFQKRKALRLPAKLNESVIIRVGDTAVEEVDVFREAHYIVFLYTDPGSEKVAASVVENINLDFQLSEESTEEVTN